jgi:hypothetical protein
MAVELLGGNVFPHVFIVCAIAYLASGHRGIYPSQRVARGKLVSKPHEEIVLRDWPRSGDAQ